VEKVEERVSNFKADKKNSSSKLALQDTKFEEERERALHGNGLDTGFYALE
jgi:hypothetical protein